MERIRALMFPLFVLAVVVGVTALLATAPTQADQTQYRAEFAPAVVRGDPVLNAINPALIERMRKEDSNTTVVQMVSGAQYRVACGIDKPATDHNSCSWLFRVAIWVEN